MYRSIRIILLVLILMMAAYSANELVSDLAKVQAEEAKTGTAWLEKDGIPYRERLFVSFLPKDEVEGRKFLVKELEGSGSTLFYVDYLGMRFSPDSKMLSDTQLMLFLPEEAVFWENIPGYDKDAPHRYVTVEEEGYQKISFLHEGYARKENHAVSCYVELDLENPPLDSTPHEGRWGLFTNEGSRIREDLRKNFPKAEIHLWDADDSELSWTHHQLRWFLLFLFFFVYAMFLSLRVEKERNIRLLLGRRLFGTYGQLYFLPFVKSFALYMISWQFFLLVFLKFRLSLFPWAFSHLKKEWKVILLFLAVIVLIQLLFFMLSEWKRRKGAKGSFELPGLVPLLFTLLLIFLSISIPLFVKNMTTLTGLVKTQSYLSNHPELKENTGFNLAVLAFKDKAENMAAHFSNHDLQANRDLRLFLEDYDPLVFDLGVFMHKQRMQTEEAHPAMYKGPPWIILNQRMYEKLAFPLAKEPEVKDIAESKNLLLIIPKGKKLRKGDLAMLPSHNHKVHRVYLRESFTMQDPTLREGELREPYFAVLPDAELLDTLNFPDLFFEKLSEKEREEILTFIDEQEREARWEFFEDNARRMVLQQKMLSEEIRAIMKTTGFSFVFILLAVWFMELFSHYKKKKELALHLLLGKKVYWIYLKQHLPLLLLEIAVLLMLWKFSPKLSYYLELKELWRTLVSVALFQLLLGYGFFLFIVKKGVKYMLVEGEI